MRGFVIFLAGLGFLVLMAFHWKPDTADAAEDAARAPASSQAQLALPVNP